MIPMTQLALFPDPPAAPPAGEIDIVDALLAAHGGDARVVIHELLADADFLRDQPDDEQRDGPRMAAEI